jgi:hypothetical protein
MFVKGFYCHILYNTEKRSPISNIRHVRVRMAYEQHTPARIKGLEGPRHFVIFVEQNIFYILYSQHIVFRRTLFPNFEPS